MDWSEVPNLSVNDAGQCVIAAPPDGGQCTPIFEGIGECKFQTGACFSFGVDRPSESANVTSNKEHKKMALPAGFPPPVQKTAKAAKVVSQSAPDMSEAPAPAPEVPALPATVPSAPAVAGLPGAVGVPAIPSGGAFGELGHLPAASNISPLTIVLALVAVGGGGAAWKFYSQRSKEKHEEAMLKIEKGVDADAEKNDQQRQKCDAAAQTAKEKIEGLTVRADATDKAVEELDKKLTAIESRTEELETKLSAMERKLPDKKPTEKKTKGAAK